MFQSIHSHDLSRLCEVKAFSGSGDSLHTPFKETCENLSKSEIGYDFLFYRLCSLYVN